MRLGDFAGLWTLERRIEDARAGETLQLSGAARFTLAAPGLAYREDGALRFGNGPKIAASRGYLWREAAGTIEVLFEDGGFFHRFVASETDPAAAHDCPPDRYRVRYDFGRWPRWRAEWRVQGPRKDYVSVSTYRPAGQGGADAA